MTVSFAKSPAHVLSVAAFAEVLRRAPASLLRAILYVGEPGNEIPVRVLETPEDTSVPFPLVFSFHGARPENAAMPLFFGSQLYVKDHTSRRMLLAISDPTLEIAPSLRFSWYGGAAGRDVPGALAALLKGLTTGLAPSRTVFVGGSIGAHAVLRHARAFPDAMMVLANPLPVISKYYPNVVKAYYDACWPGAYDPETLTCPHVPDDASLPYETGVLQNTVLILQSANDPHLARQVAPLIARLGKDPHSAARLLPLIDFFPEARGHRIEFTEFARCVEAAVISPGRDAETLALTRERLDFRTSPMPRRVEPDTSADIALSDQLVSLARRA